MDIRPTPDAILASVSDYLRDRLLPGLAGEARFGVRLAIKALALVEREIRLGDAARAGDAARLHALLGNEYDPATADDLLCRRIGAGQLGPEDTGLIDHLWATTLDRIRIDQPDYASIGLTHARSDVAPREKRP